MAKKRSKQSKKTAPKKKPTGTVSSAPKAPTKKKSSKKKTTKKPVTKKSTTKKAATKKAATKKPVTKKAPGKKTPGKKVAKKAPVKKAAGKKKTVTKAAAGKAASTTTPPPGSAGAAQAAGRKGITIVSNHKKRRPRSSPKTKAPLHPPVPSLLGPGSKWHKSPLIPSGPKNKTPSELAGQNDGKKKKSPFNKRKLDKFRTILVMKRAEVFGDLEDLETEALRGGGSGGASKLPQHLAEQGSDSADQNLSLNLAEADRRLIREIDDALQRIEDRSYGLCEVTGEPISEARLEELPWARHSIEAARRLERGH